MIMGKLSSCMLEAESRWCMMKYPTDSRYTDEVMSCWGVHRLKRTLAHWHESAKPHRWDLAHWHEMATPQRWEIAGPNTYCLALVTYTESDINEQAWSHSAAVYLGPLTLTDTVAVVVT